VSALKNLKTIILSSALLIVAACSAPNAPDSTNATVLDQVSIKNQANPESSIYTGGQPSQEALTALSKAGVKHVINLRPLQEQSKTQDWNEAEFVKSLGMQYHSIPVAGAADVNFENATKLADLIKSIDGEPTLLHCASSNRVGALKALYEGAVNGVNSDQAIAEGKRWGLGSLEPLVRDQLNNPQ